jgi:hypothetical protein
MEAQVMERINAAPTFTDSLTADLGGRRPWPAIMMLMCLMLAKCSGLSDPQLEECLKDRLSFQPVDAIAV